jgi:AcrR family transcriptional regulator
VSIEERKERERQQREDGIVAAAEKVFLAKGFAAASMDEIAKEADFSKPTLYQYFRDKETLYLAVSSRALERLRDAVFSGSEDGACAWTRLERRGERLLDFCESQPGLFRMVDALSRIRPDPSGSRPERDGLADFNDRLFRDTAELVKAAQAEGSVDPSLDPFSCACQLMFVMTGFMNQWAQTGATFAEHFDLDGKLFARGAISLVLRGIRARDKE